MAGTLSFLQKHTIRLSYLGLALLLPMIALCSCASGDYWTDRRNDMADILTATVGTGLGAKARVGPLHAGLFVGEDAYGLRGGTWGSQKTRMGDAPVPVDLDLLLVSTETYQPSESYARGKNFYAAGVPLISVTKYSDNPAYYTQIEVAVAVGGELRVGFNPGEFLDFLLGFTILDIFHDDVRWQTRFERAVAEGNMKKFEALLRRGADVNAVIRSDRPLHVAVSYGQEAIASALIAAGADVNGQDIEGRTPLHRACSLESDISLRLVNLLLEHGAAIDALDSNHSTPLVCAVESANMEVIRTLLSHNANPNTKTFSRKTPLKIAEENGLTEIADLLRQNGASE